MANETKASGSAGIRVVAIIFWLLAAALELLTVAVIAGKVTIPVIPVAVTAIVLIVLDLVLVLVGSNFWRKANKIDAIPESDSFAYRIRNNLGVVMAAFAFVPFLLIALSSKNADGKTKGISAGASIIAIVLGVLISVL